MKQKRLADRTGTVTRVIGNSGARCPIQSITTAQMGICCKKNELTEETVIVVFCIVNEGAKCRDTAETRQ